MAVALAALGAVAAAAVLVVIFATAGGHRYEAEIRRTAYGIPHIRANDYGASVTGTGTPSHRTTCASWPTGS